MLAARSQALRKLQALIRRLEGVKLGIDTNNTDLIHKYSSSRPCIIDHAYDAWAAVTRYLIALSESAPKN